MKTVYGIMLLILLVSMLTGTFNFQQVKAGGSVGVKAGDWIKYNVTTTYTSYDYSEPQPQPQWILIEFQSVEGTTLTGKMTGHMSDGTEQIQNFNLDVATGRGNATPFFVIPANSKPGDPVIFGPGGVINGETIRTYAGVDRTSVYATISETSYSGTSRITIYWDKQTGVVVEAYGTSERTSMYIKATETNMWQASIFGTQTEPIELYVLMAVIIIGVMGTIAFIMLKKKTSKAT